MKQWGNLLQNNGLLLRFTCVYIHRLVYIYIWISNFRLNAFKAFRRTSWTLFPLFFSSSSEILLHSYMLRIFEILSILNEATRTNTDHCWRCHYFNGATFSNWLSVDWCSQDSDFICTLRGVILKVRTWWGIVVQLFKENIIIKRKKHIVTVTYRQTWKHARARTVLYTLLWMSVSSHPPPLYFIHHAW